MKRIAILLAALAPHLAAPHAQATERVYRVDDYPGKTDLQKINTALASMKAVVGPKTLVFDRREYIIEPAELDTFEPVIGVDGISQLTLDGNGAILVAKNALNCQKGYFFKISRFEDIKVQNLSLTYRPLPYVQGTIVSANQELNRVVVELDWRFNDIESLSRTPHSEFFCRAGLKETPIHPKPGSPSWMGVETDEKGQIARQGASSRRVELGVGRFDQRETLGGEYNWQRGDPIVIWKRGAQDGFCFEQGEKLTLDNVKVNSALHFAIKLRGVFNARIVDCQVIPVEGGMLSGCADGIDVQQSKNISIENCLLIASGDDAVSFLNHGHGYNGEHHEERFSDPYPDSNNGVVIRDNLLEGGNRNGMLLLADNVLVESNQVLNIRQYGIKFTGSNTTIRNNVFREVASFSAYKHITDELNTGVICSDEWVQRNVIISGNHLEDWRHMPGILLKSVERATVENNTFIMNDPRHIAEKPFNAYLDENKAICVTSGFFQNTTHQSSYITIRGNKIEAYGKWGSIDDAVYINGDHKTIRVINNTMKNKSLK